MGLFSSKKITYVDSAAYNIAGDYHERTNYMKTIITASATGYGTSKYIGESIVKGIAGGPNKSQRNTMRWALQNYSEGVPTVQMGGQLAFDNDAITAFMTDYVGKPVIVTEAIAGLSQIEYWAQRFMYDNYSNGSGGVLHEWTYSSWETATGIAQVRVDVVDVGTFYVAMPEYVKDAPFAYITYNTYAPEPVEGGGEPVPVERGPFMLIYRQRSGIPAIDVMWPAGEDYRRQFMPFVPLRIENKFITEAPYRATYYEKSRKFYKKAMNNKKIDDLIDKIGENEKLGDIDFAFMVYGVALNTKTNECKRYLYEFFRNLMDIQRNDGVDYQNFLTRHAAVTAAANEVEKLYEQYRDTDVTWDAYERYQRLPKPNMGWNRISQRATWLPNLYQIQHGWVYVQQEILTGANNPGRKVGDVWLEKRPADSITTISLWRRRTGGRGDSELVVDKQTEKYEKFWITRQVTANSALRLTVLGLEQENIVYNGQAIWTDSDKALDDPEESDLLIPIHTQAFNNLNAKTRNQICVENVYVIFNCYKIVKIRWYQRGFFKVLFAIVLAVVAAFFMPMLPGLFGPAMTVGTAMGFSGMTAAIIGSVTNAIAGMMLSTLVQTMAGKGGVLGAVLGAILGFVLMNGMSSVFATGTWNFNWTDLFSVQNLLKMTDAASNIYGTMVQADMASMQAELEQLQTETDKQLKEIQKRYTDVLNVGNTYINPMKFVDSARTFVETGDAFIARTLLTGMDIAELSNEMLNKYCELNLSLPDAYG